MGWLDLIFPKACLACGALGSYLCKNCEAKIQYLDSQICPHCGRGAIDGQTHPRCQRPLGLDGLISLVYFTYPINKIIHKLKYRFTTDATQELFTKLQPNRQLQSLEGILIPVPLHWQRQNYRGFNHAELLSKIYAKELGLQLASGLVKKSVATKPQVGLKRVERQTNVKDVFTLTGEVRNKNFIIFDDVWTSGATLRSIGQLLKKNRAGKVWGFTLARSR